MPPVLFAAPSTCTECLPLGCTWADACSVNHHAPHCLWPSILLCRAATLVWTPPPPRPVLQLRVRLLARQGRSAEGQQGQGLTAWQLRNLRQSQRREQGAAAAAAERQDDGSDSGVELSSDDDFDVDLPVPRRRPPGPDPSAAVPLGPTATMAALPPARAASSPAGATPPPASAASPPARESPLQAQPPPVPGPCGLRSPPSIVPLPPKPPASAATAREEEVATPAAASSRVTLPTMQAVSIAAPTRVRPPALSAASLLPAPAQPAASAGATQAGPQGEGAPGAAPAAPLAPHDAVGNRAKWARVASPTAAYETCGAGEAAQRSSDAQPAAALTACAARGAMSPEEWERGCGRVPATAAAPHHTPASPRAGGPSSGSPSVRGAAHEPAVPGWAAQAATQGSSPRHKARCVGSPLQVHAGQAQPQVLPQVAGASPQPVAQQQPQFQEHEQAQPEVQPDSERQAQAAPADTDHARPPAEAPSFLTALKQHISGAEAAATPASRGRKTVPSSSPHKRMRTLFDLGCKLMPGTPAKGSPAQMPAAPPTGGPSSAALESAAHPQGVGAAAAAPQAAAEPQLVTPGPPAGRADDAAGTMEGDGLEDGCCDTGAAGQQDSPVVVRDSPARPREQRSGATEVSPGSHRRSLPQRRLRPRDDCGQVRDPLAPGDGYRHEGAVIVIDDEDDA